MTTGLPFRHNHARKHTHSHTNTHTHTHTNKHTNTHTQELMRAPYALIAVGTLGAYLAHPFMQAGAALVTNTGLVEGGLFDSLS